MVELARGATIAGLEAQGWTRDALCAELHRSDLRIGGPTYMRAPDGRLHAVSVGEPRVLEGSFPGEGGRSIALVDGTEMLQES